MSDKTARRLTRILAMLPWVIANPGASVDAVCARFDYTRRQLVEDLDLVFVCGLPGYGPGELMVAYVDDDEVVVDMADYFAQPLRLRPEEALGLVAVSLTLEAAGDASSPLTSAVEKLLGVLVGDGSEVVAVSVNTDEELLGTLRAAIDSEAVLELTYTSLGKGDTTVREVEPWQVVTSRGQWYLDAWCRRSGGERRFRIDRIRDVRPTGESFEPPTVLPDPELHYVPGEDDVRATLRLRPGGRWAADYYPVVVLEDEGEAGLVVEMAAAAPGVIARLLLRLGSDADLLAGDSVATELSELRTSILARYRDE